MAIRRLPGLSGSRRESLPTLLPSEGPARSVRADVAQLAEQRSRKRQVKGRAPYVDSRVRHKVVRAPLWVSGSCTLDFTPSSTTAQTITAAYGGDSTHAISSGSASVTAALRSTTTVVSCAVATPRHRAPWSRMRWLLLALASGWSSQNTSWKSLAGDLPQKVDNPTHVEAMIEAPEVLGHFERFFERFFERRLGELAVAPGCREWH